MRDWPLARLGVPLNPGRDGRHALCDAEGERVELSWHAATQTWSNGQTSWEAWPGYDYLGPLQQNPPRASGLSFDLHPVATGFSWLMSAASIALTFLAFSRKRNWS